jgi:4-diphosphocytidyl-2C-methyl-D-erythritol kinase
MFKKLDALDYAWRDFGDPDEVYNDFERVAPCQSLDLIERLQVAGAQKAGLSGSGSAIFGLCENQTTARQAAERMRFEGVPFVTVAPTLSRSESL